MVEDYIDFPVSDLWRDYYYEVGLTPYPSPRRKDRYSEEIALLREELAQLREVVAGITIPKVEPKKQLSLPKSSSQQNTPVRKDKNNRKWVFGTR